MILHRVRQARVTNAPQPDCDARFRAQVLWVQAGQRCQDTAGAFCGVLHGRARRVWILGAASNLVSW